MTDETDDELVERALLSAGLVHPSNGRRLRLIGQRDDRAEWLEWRRGGLGASDIAAVLGLSPYASAYSIWAEKIGLVPPDSGEVSEAMEYGQRSEEMNRGYFEDRTKLMVSGQQTRVERPDAPWMRCTVDGFAYDVDGNPFSDDGHAFDPSTAVAVVEFKASTDPPASWETAVPLHYACQATWTSIVTGHPVVMFGVLHSTFRLPVFRLYTFTPTPDDVALLTARGRAFWFDHVLTKTAPDPDGSEATTQTLKRMFPFDDDEATVEADDECRRAIDRIHANRERVKICQKLIDEAQNVLRDAMGDAATMTSGVDERGRPKVVATWKTQTRSAYVVEASTSRVLRVKG